MENEIMTTDNEIVEVSDVETESSGNGLKTVGVLALTAAIGTGLFFGAKKLVKKSKEKKQDKYIEVEGQDPVEEVTEKVEKVNDTKKSK